MWIGTHIYDFLVLPKARVSSHVYLRRKRRQILVVGTRSCILESPPSDMN